MINPLLHTNSSSAPTSPRCTRSALENASQKRVLANLRSKRDKSPALVAVASNIVLPHHQPNLRQRRLSRVVKCRTVDFTEFPEGMRDYRNGKRLLREIQSQPGSPVIPRIEIHDFGSEV